MTFYDFMLHHGREILPHDKALTQPAAALTDDIALTLYASDTLPKLSAIRAELVPTRKTAMQYKADKLSFSWVPFHQPAFSLAYYAILTVRYTPLYWVKMYNYVNRE